MEKQGKRGSQGGSQNNQDGTIHGAVGTLDKSQFPTVRSDFKEPPKVGTLTEEALEEELKRQKALEERKKQVAGWLAGVPDSVRTLIERKVRYAGTEYDKVSRVAEGNLREFLNFGDDYTQARVLWIYARELVTLVRDASEKVLQLGVREVLDDLVEKGAICVLPAGKPVPSTRFPWGRDTYYVPVAYHDVSRGDVDAVFHGLHKIASRDLKESQTERKVAEARFKSGVDLSKDVADFFAKVAGVYILHLLPQPYIFKDEKDGGKEKKGTRPGGRIKVESGRTVVKALGVWGGVSFRKYCQNIIDREVTVQVGCWEQDKVKIPSELFNSMSKEDRFATFSLHGLLKRAYALYQFKSRQTVTAHQLLVKGESGVAYLYHRSFQVGERTYFYPGILVERDEKKGIRLVDVFVTAEDLFTVAAAEWHEEANLPELFAAFFNKAKENILKGHDEEDEGQANGNQPKVDLPPAAPVEDAETTEPEVTDEVAQG